MDRIPAFMAHLHCRKRTWVRIRTRIPVLCRNREQRSESESVQCEHVLHSTMQPLGLESESEFESVSVDVNEPLAIVLGVFALFRTSLLRGRR